METYLNTNGDECVMWSDEQVTHSMLKSTYDEMKANEATVI
jgi:hypothetical protein